jgi:hypothetical protein
MFDRFTDQAKQMLNHARLEVLDMNHDSLGVEHMLLGLLGMPEPLGPQFLTRVQESEAPSQARATTLPAVATRTSV